MVLGPAAQQSSWPAAPAVASAPFRLGGRHAPAWSAALRRDGRRARAALEGVRAHTRGEDVVGPLVRNSGFPWVFRLEP